MQELADLGYIYKGGIATIADFILIDGDSYKSPYNITNKGKCYRRLCIIKYYVKGATDFIYKLIK